jgi:hypothetical protein
MLLSLGIGILYLAISDITSKCIKRENIIIKFIVKTTLDWRIFNNINIVYFKTQLKIILIYIILLYRAVVYLAIIGNDKLLPI